MQTSLYPTHMLFEAREWGTVTEDTSFLSNSYFSFIVTSQDRNFVETTL
jgi:hypothetical protein